MPKSPRPAKRSRTRASPGPAAPAHRCEADVVEGLEAIAAEELRGRFGPRVGALRVGEGTLRFHFAGALADLLALRSVQAVYLVYHHPVPRPKALLGDEAFRALQAQVDAVRALQPDRFRLLHLSAAGSESAVMQRLQDDLAERLGLGVALDEGDLLLRLRRPPGGAEGWEALVRLSPRPLVTRAWRVCNMEGALNATVAQAMVQLTRPTQSDVFLNLACGSGTLLAERRAIGPSARLLGCDTNPAALDCARENLAADVPSGTRKVRDVELHGWDAHDLPMPATSVDVLVADLPFGHLVGSHAENLTLYPAILDEAARVARPGSPFILITHELRLTEGLLAANRLWRTRQTLRVTLGGLHPAIFVLERRNERRTT